jgi:Spy/CpxP family protein refolding chaperone
MQAILRIASLLLLLLGATLPSASAYADDESGYYRGHGMMWGGGGPGGQCPYGDCRMGPGGSGGYGPSGWGGMGPGMMWDRGCGGMGMGPGMMGIGPMHMLNLTDEQRDKIEKIHDAEHKKHLDVAGKMFEQQTRLRDLTQEDKPDPKKVGAAYGEIAKLQQQMLEAHVQAFNQMQDVLTREQRDQLKQWRRGGYGPGYGPHGPGFAPRGPGAGPR